MLKGLFMVLDTLLNITTWAIAISIPHQSAEFVTCRQFCPYIMSFTGGEEFWSRLYNTIHYNMLRTALYLIQAASYHDVSEPLVPGKLEFKTILFRDLAALV
ncbi:Cytochrome P450 monooxygenase aclL [Fusarium oxysporum f. sp. albedinis]|nr:Cytochrome P450 monooxygenase aclL [Fusarium oxysporum f. sp. albedinis]